MKSEELKLCRLQLLFLCWQIFLCFFSLSFYFALADFLLELQPLVLMNSELIQNLSHCLRQLLIRTLRFMSWPSVIKRFDCIFIELKRSCLKNNYLSTLSRSLENAEKKIISVAVSFVTACWVFSLESNVMISVLALIHIWHKIKPEIAEQNRLFLFLTANLPLRLPSLGQQRDIQPCWRQDWIWHRRDQAPNLLGLTFLQDLSRHEDTWQWNDECYRRKPTSRFAILTDCWRDIPCEIIGPSHVEDATCLTDSLAALL